MLIIEIIGQTEMMARLADVDLNTFHKVSEDYQ